MDPQQKLKLGQRVIKAVIPSIWANMTVMSHDTRITRNTLSEWNSGRVEPKEESLERISETILQLKGIHVSTIELFAGQITGSMPNASDPMPNRAYIVSALYAVLDQEVIDKLNELPADKYSEKPALWWAELALHEQHQIVSSQVHHALPSRTPSTVYQLRKNY